MERPADDYPRFTLGPALSDEQCAFFARWGFLHFRAYADAATVQALIAASQRLERRWLAQRPSRINGVPIRYGQDLDGRPIVQRFAFANQHEIAFARLLDDARLRALFALIPAGHDVRLGAREKDGVVINHYVHGPLSRHSRLGWHTDGLRDLFLGTRLRPLLNVGLHLDTLDAEHGGLRLLAGTHRQPLRQMLFRKRYFLDHEADADEIAIVPAAGDLTVHDGRLWHRVAQSCRRGEPSRRRVIYVPIIDGPFAPRHADSPTPLYQRLARLAR